MGLLKHTQRTDRCSKRGLASPASIENVAYVDSLKNVKLKTESSSDVFIGTTSLLSHKNKHFMRNSLQDPFSEKNHRVIDEVLSSYIVYPSGTQNITQEKIEYFGIFNLHSNQPENPIADRYNFSGSKSNSPVNKSAYVSNLRQRDSSDQHDKKQKSFFFSLISKGMHRIFRKSSETKQRMCKQHRPEIQTPVNTTLKDTSPSKRENFNLMSSEMEGEGQRNSVKTEETSTHFEYTFDDSEVQSLISRTDFSYKLSVAAKFKSLCPDKAYREWEKDGNIPEV